MSEKILIAFLWLFANCLSFSAEQTQNESVEDIEIKKSVLIFQTLLKQRRSEQIKAAKHLLTFTYEQQYKMLSIMMNKMFEVILSSKIILEASGYIPGEALPLNETVKDGLYKILDNTAFYSEFQLKMPDVCDRIMKSNQEWLLLIKWAIGFSNTTNLYDEKTTELINLTAQEMNLIDRSPSYINPYRSSDGAVKGHVESSEKNLKKKFSKGPKFTKQKHTEL